MALPSIMFKADVAIADIDRGYYRDHLLRLAQHPSETAERMMLRLLAFVLHAHEGLEFGRGLSTEDEPDLWRRDLTGAIVDWIDVGLPDPRELRRACGRAERVHVLAYGGRAVDVWWNANGAALARLPALGVVEVPQEASRALGALAERAMNLAVTVQEGNALVTAGHRTVDVALRVRKVRGEPAA